MLRDDLIAGHGGKATFPDLVLRTNQNDPTFQGGEFIEIKDATTSYNIASFNSTIPSAYKNIDDYVGTSSKLYEAILEADGNDPYHLISREVYYLIRGRQRKDDTNCKVCLVQGGFFETLSVTENIKSALNKSLREAMAESDIKGDDYEESINDVLSFNWKREHLSRVRHHEKSSISLRMRVMTEVVKEANVLNENQYPDITDNTLNMLVPAHTEARYEELARVAIQKMSMAFGLDNNALPPGLEVKKLKHLRNGPFVLFQTTI